MNQTNFSKKDAVLKGAGKYLSIILFLMLAVISFPTLVSAEVVMDLMTIDLKPEYDQPGLFTSYSGTLVNTGDQEWQGEVVFRIPKDAKIEYACEIEQGEHICQLYEVQEKKDYKEITWTASKPVQPKSTLQIYLEYYSDSITGNPEKHLDFTYIRAYPVNDLTIRVTEPARSSNFRMNPAPTTMYRSPENLNIHEYSIRNYDQDKLNISVDYTKNDSRPSVTNATTARSGPSSTVSPLGEGGAVLLLVGVAAIIAVAAVFLKQKNSSGSRGNNNSKAERAKARRLLLDGKITEQTYNRLLKEIKSSENQK